MVIRSTEHTQSRKKERKVDGEYYATLKLSISFCFPYGIGGISDMGVT